MRSPATPTWRHSLARHGAVLGVLLLAAWGLASLDVNPGLLGQAPARVADFIARATPPDLSILDVVVKAVVETLQIAFLGTFFSVLISFPLGLLAAANLTPRGVHLSVKTVLTLMRAVPVILLALLFVSALGLGAVAGVIAVTVHSVGMLGKFFAEALENAAPGPQEALDSAGATWWQKVRFAVIKPVMPDFVRDSLFRLELNIREAEILGLVGAGGIGLYIQLYSRSFQYPKVATLTIVVVLIAVIVEQLSVALRRRLR